MEHKINTSTESVESYEIITSVVFIPSSRTLIFNAKKCICLENGEMIETSLETDNVALPEESQLIADILAHYTPSTSQSQDD